MPLAFLFERYTFPLRRLFAVFAALPLVLPPLVGTVAFILLCGESGILARLTQAVLGLESAPWTLRGWPALLLFHTYTMYPFFYVLTGAGLRRIDAGLAEAGRSLGANSFAVLIRIILPQLTPSLLAAGLLTFMVSMASFSAPLLFGGNVRVLTLEIFTARQRGDAAVALTETVILAVISLSALVFFQRYEGTRKFAAAAMKGAGRRLKPITSGKARLAAMLCGVVFSVMLVLPVATLALVSFARDGAWTTQTLPPTYTLNNYSRILTDKAASEVFINSLSMAGIASLAALLWSFCVATIVAGKKRSKWRRLLSLLVLVPWALPGTVVAISIAEAYGKPSPLFGSFILVGTFWILPVIYFLRFMPLVVRAVQASMEQLDPALDEGRWEPGCALVAKVFASHPSVGVAGRISRNVVGVCHRFGRVCGFGISFRSGEQADFDRDCVRVTRLQSRLGSGLRDDPDCAYRSQHDRGGKAGASSGFRLKENGHR